MFEMTGRPTEIQGHFWLPGKEDARLRGTIHLAPNVPPRLALSGHFQGVSGFRVPDDGLRLVYGEAFYGRKLVLFDAFWIKSFSNDSEYVFHRIIEGPDFVDVNDLVFDSCTTAYDQLQGWVDDFIDLLDSEVDDKRVNREFRIPQIQSSVNFASHRVHSGSQKQWTSRQEDFVEIRPDSLQSILWFESQVKRVRLLISLLLATPTNTQFMRLSRMEDREGVDFFYYFPESHLVPSENLYWQEVPFRYSFIEGQMESILTKWYDFLDTDKLTPMLFFSIMASEKQDHQLRFISLMQALESFDRAQEKSPSRYMEDGLYVDEVLSEIVKSIPPKIDEDLKEKIKSSLSYCNEWSLARRMKRLVEDLPRCLKKKSNLESKHYRKQIVDTRNFLTHRVASLGESSLQGESFFRATQDIELLLYCSILSRIGVQADLISRQLENCPLMKSKFMQWRDE
jgi:hypothetical protein